MKTNLFSRRILEVIHGMAKHLIIVTPLIVSIFFAHLDADTSVPLFFYLALISFLLCTLLFIIKLLVRRHFSGKSWWMKLSSSRWVPLLNLCLFLVGVVMIFLGYISYDNQNQHFRTGAFLIVSFFLIRQFFKNPKEGKLLTPFCIFIIGVLIFSPVLGYTSNYVTSYRLEKFASTLPPEIRRIKISAQNKFPENTKQLIRKKLQGRLFLIEPNANGDVVLIIKSYSLCPSSDWRYGGQRDAFYLRGMRWERRISRHN